MIRSRLRLGRWRLHGAAGIALAVGVVGVALAPAFMEAGDGERSAPNRSVDPHLEAAAQAAAGTPAECQVSEPLPSGAAVMSGLVEQLRAERADDAGDLVVLNGRGYNYGPPPGVGIDPVIPRGATPRAPAAR